MQCAICGKADTIFFSGFQLCEKHWYEAMWDMEIYGHYIILKRVENGIVVLERADPAKVIYVKQGQW